MARRTLKKAVNRAKATLEERRGPVNKDQSAAPIVDAIRAYWERDTLTFGVPAHNGGRGPLPEIAKLAGLDAVRADVSMSHGVDTRDRAWQVQSSAQELFAEAVGAQQVLFSTNGSSLSAHVAIMAVAGPGETLVMARTGHKSAFAGLVLAGAMPVWVDPFYDEELEVALGVLAPDLGATLDAHPEARAALVFTPSYY